MKLNSKYIERNIKNVKVYSYDRVASTNDVAKTFAANGCEEGSIFCATRQTAGKGRLGRTFLSKKGGVYFSIVLRPQKDNADTLFITVAAAVAAARAIQDVSGKKCDIKWVNDIYINNKKVCGILTEGSVGPDGAIDYAVLGVGINLFKPSGGFGANLPLAGSVFDKTSHILCKRRVKADVIAKFTREFFAFYKNLNQKQFMNEYKIKSFLTGKQITFIKDGVECCGVVKGIDDDARLIVTIGENEHVLSHGEIQIVGMEQLAI